MTPMKIDMHVHTRFSRDSSMRVEDLVESATKKGLDGVAITDHDTMEGFREIEGLDHGLEIIPGMEITTERGELLGLFLEEEVDSKDAEKVVKEVKEQGGLVVVPHPFDPFRSFNGWQQLDGINGIEVFNSRNLTSCMNKKAKNYIQGKDLIKTAGSDAHSPWEIAKAYVEVDAKDLKEFKERLINEEVEIKGRRGSVMSYIHGNLEKVKNLLKRN